MVVDPGEIPSSVACTDPGMEVLEVGSVTDVLAVPGEAPNLAIIALPEVSATVSGLESGISVVTLKVVVLPV